MMQRDQQRLAGAQDLVKRELAAATQLPDPSPQPAIAAQPAPLTEPRPSAQDPLVQTPQPAAPISAPADDPVLGSGLAGPADVDDELDHNKLQHRIRTVEGMLEQERRASQEREQKLMAKHQELQQQLEDATRPPPETIRLEDHFDPAEIEEIGSEVLMKQLQSNRRLAAQAIEQQVKPLQQELKQLRQERTDDAQAQEVRRQGEFLAALTAAIPNWQKWAMKGSLDPRFKDWLAVTVYGKARGDLLVEAQTRLDSKTVIHMLNEFKDNLVSGTQTPARDSRHMPSGSAPSDDPPPPVAQFDFTLSQIKQFNDDVLHGRYKGKARAMMDLDNRIRQARLANRIGPG